MFVKFCIFFCIATVASGLVRQPNRFAKPNALKADQKKPHVLKADNPPEYITDDQVFVDQETNQEFFNQTDMLIKNLNDTLRPDAAKIVACYFAKFGDRLSVQINSKQGFDIYQVIDFINYGIDECQEATDNQMIIAAGNVWLRWGTVMENETIPDGTRRKRQVKHVASLADQMKTRCQGTHFPFPCEDIGIINGVNGKDFLEVFGVSMYLLSEFYPGLSCPFDLADRLSPQLFEHNHNDVQYDLITKCSNDDKAIALALAQKMLS
ncbi:unnamed protein product [Bursaphelenchus okinawaensis]|uniref:Uncharacterized protein n=1 Tax=Bursaphelenchus okinawaensis TaxID=465554 RepID=A0A811JVN9_9BILA|nr:unnamed protein product [Bursaphelenchus okinawaensis]CAG9086076.1 unnamed protein product [Bursaphelenchus okinawaensis]